MRRAARTDANHAEIVAALRKVGCYVESLAALGGGVPDLLVGRDGQWHVIEVKDGTKSPSRQKLTEDEVRWIESARRFAPVHVVNSVSGALQAVQRRAA